MAKWSKKWDWKDEKRLNNGAVISFVKSLNVKFDGLTVAGNRHVAVGIKVNNRLFIGCYTANYGHSAGRRAALATAAQYALRYYLQHSSDIRLQRLSNYTVDGDLIRSLVNKALRAKWT